MPILSWNGGAAMKSARGFLLFVALACPVTPARADIWDWIWQKPDCAPNTGPFQARHEWELENQRARCLGYLDCGGLRFIAESQRHGFNQQVLGVYMRPYSSLGVSSAPTPRSSSTTSESVAPATSATPTGPAAAPASGSPSPAPPPPPTPAPGPASGTAPAPTTLDSPSTAAPLPPR